ncbi:MAG: hypothetical protein GTO45_13620 [Candidatus Aminicenantes bacterium]|nr:hypothetical protein [Candidatus Aminicenantes bacterium]NIM79815.1 hypothetical protein [Candidatus Aminicenantes bacterium]NIN19145.1 hypothetical protein [Candidatus Aminicenantes bacterium]NIN43049.1 hypothetical protein [Candidatus Aminicenantes bacterium]NIN85790.1 hypothetical protein [Candidatus Aminicenantes bacterium]
MSTKIKFWFEKIPSPVLEEKIPDIGTLTRLFCTIKMKSGNGWSDSLNAILDTGAPFSVIPLDIWTDLETKIITEHEIRGINPRKECTLPALIGKTKCILLDEEGNQSKELEILCYFALSNLVPIIVGFKDILENFRICFNYKDNTAFAEER